ncbi:hypothetical protein OAE13_04530 [Flavobacteriaceae bacterium]|nr:hypothetical protein [Flavobacteriaceae bacterium]
MKHIKDITISIFAIIGFAFVLSSFTSNETTETQESHIWGVSDLDDEGGVYLYSKKNGVMYYANGVQMRLVELDY